MDVDMDTVDTVKAIEINQNKDDLPILEREALLSIYWERLAHLQTQVAHFKAEDEKIRKDIAERPQVGHGATLALSRLGDARRRAEMQIRRVEGDMRLLVPGFEAEAESESKSE
jgi:hypothetical protein